MSSGLTVTLPQTEQFLREQFGLSVTDVELAGSGGWSQAYSYVIDGTKYVIRWSQVADNFERDAYAIRYAREELPIPRIMAMGHSAHAYYAVSPFVSGAFLESLSSKELEHTTPALLNVFHAIRSVDLSTTSGFGFWNGQGVGSHESWRAFLLDDKNESPGSLIHGWRAKLEASSMGTDAYDRLRQSLASLALRCPEERSLVHCDLLNRNVLARFGKITAVLDWGSSFYGDALYEIAWLIFCVLWFPQLQDTGLTRILLDDFKEDPNTNKADIETRLLCYLVNIGMGSIAYNAYIENWPVAENVAQYTLGLLR